MIEMLAVITAISIFIGFLFPIGDKIVRKVRMSKDAHHLRQIALAYQVLAGEDEEGTLFNTIQSSNDWAICLAANGGINEAQCYVSALNPIESQRIVDAGRQVIGNFKQQRLDWICLAPIPPNAPVETTPLLYTRGLNIATGEWETDGVYGTQGGYVVFLDGHVKFYRQLKQALVHHKTGQPTSNLQEAVAEQTHAYDSKGRLW